MRCQISDLRSYYTRWDISHAACLLAQSSAVISRVRLRPGRRCPSYFGTVRGAQKSAASGRYRIRLRPQVEAELQARGAYRTRQRASIGSHYLAIGAVNLGECARKHHRVSDTILGTV